MYNLSAAMAGNFVEATKEMTAKIQDLGPNPLRISRKESGS
jgi:coenzyme F420-reducing hydrogenase delta subunit